MSTHFFMSHQLAWFPQMPSSSCKQKMTQFVIKVIRKHYAECLYGSVTARSILLCMYLHSC